MQNKWLYLKSLKVRYGFVFTFDNDHTHNSATTDWLIDWLIDM